ncbi:glycoside hydrolase family 53 protein [Flavobacterium sp.]|uniref:glycoside hydrolase family 53 protein n=1 Tax=Flavobacterium sp. TaxID=239 RepID=UPI002FD93053
MKKIVFSLILIPILLIFTHCSDSEKSPEEETPTATDPFIRAADLSFLPEAESAGALYKNNGQNEAVLTTLKNEGCNTVRLRIWKDPSSVHSGLNEVKAMAQRVKQAGLKVWLTVHYSDTWADPGQQTKPAAWQSMNFTALKAVVASYTATLMQEIQPDIIQIGNEINVGLLFPEGHLISNEAQCIELLQAASSTVRSIKPETKIMIHYAGLNGSDWFFNKMTSVDYDYIGLSYYPIWHGKQLATVNQTLTTLGNTFGKKVLIAETAYPFTLSWNDWTNNIVGLENQLIPAYPATPEGQRNFLITLKNLIQQNPHGLGFAYWGTEWTSFRGNQATNGSSWENQALWDFDSNALPAIKVFNKN